MIARPSEMRYHVVEASARESSHRGVHPGRQPAAMTSPSVIIRVPTPLRDRCGGAAELASGATTVRAALDDIARRHPQLHRCLCDETGAVRRHINLFVNAAHVRDRHGLDTPLSPGDVLFLLPAVSGG